MFHHHETPRFEPSHVPYSTGGVWYVSDAEYHAAIRRGMRLRSEIAARLVRAAGRKIAGLFRA